MAFPTSEQFCDLLGGLTTAEVTTLVAAVWSERGWDVEVQPDRRVIIATREDTADRRRLLVHHTAPRFSLPSLPTRRDDLTHVVITSSRSWLGRSLAARTDAALVTARDLRELLLYAVDADTRDTLFRTYFDRPADSFAPPRSRRSAASSPGGASRLSPVRVGTIGALALVVAAVLLAFPGAVGLDDPATDGSGATALTPGETPAPSSPALETTRGSVLRSLVFPSNGSVGVVRRGTGEHAWRMFRGGAARVGTNAPVTTVRQAPVVMARYRINTPVVSSPAVVNNTVYVGALDGVLYALDAVTLEPEWRAVVGGSTRSSPAVANGTVFLGGYGTYHDRSQQFVAAFSVRDGETRWRAPTGPVWLSSPAVVGDTVYVGVTNGMVYALDRSTGSVRWRYQTGSAVTSSPAVVNHTVYVGSNDNGVYAINATTGTLRWNVTTRDRVVSSPAVVGDTVYVGSMDGSLLALDADTGRLRWNFTTPEGVYSSPAVANGTVVFGGTGGGIYALNASTGTRRWVYRTNDTVASSPAIESGLVYIGGMDGRLYAFDLATGDRRWTFETDAAIVSSPAAVDGVIYVGSNDGYVYAIWTRLIPNFPT